jgi:glycerol-3-phosphate dehydrogenase
VIAPRDTLDVLVLGGGIHGVGVARDAAGRGLRVLLCERDDLASATSSASSKLIHGGLRYLERREFRLVRESLAEREVLLSRAPHLVRPLRFVLPHAPWLRPAWKIRLGLLLYDRFAGISKLPRSTSVRLRGGPLGTGLREEFHKGFAYSDAISDDARLVLANAVAAAELGARIATRTAVERAWREGDEWQAALRDREGGGSVVVRARAIVNAAGPWARRVLDGILPSRSALALRLVQGSHVVVPRIHEGSHALLLQNEDRRVVFVIPFERRYSLVGTTDVPFAGEPSEAAASPGEIEYLCRIVNRFFRRSIGPRDVVWSYSGVRPLLDDGEEDPSKVTREYRIEVEDERREAPLVSILGGKLTTYRKLSERVVDALAPYFPSLKKGAWTGAAPLPGGDFGEGGYEGFLEALCRDFPTIPSDTLTGLARRHGTRCREILGDAKRHQDLGPAFAPGLHEKEVAWFVEREWARTVEDVIWRRTKAGIGLGPREGEALSLAIDRFSARRTPPIVPESR